jgi:hypothetical protein
VSTAHWRLLAQRVVPHHRDRGGGVFIIILTACSTQQRAAFLLVLALWVGASALMTSLLRSFMFSAASLAGFTAVIIAADLLGAVGGAGDQAFFYVDTGTSEICIGVVCAGVVLAATEMGDAQRRLSGLFADITAVITRQFTVTLSQTGAGALDARRIRRELIRRVVALEPVIDEAIGARLQALSPTLYMTVQHMVDALATWRTISAHLIKRPDQARAKAEATLQDRCLYSDTDMIAEPGRDALPVPRLYTAPAEEIAGIDRIDAVAGCRDGLGIGRALQGKHMIRSFSQVAYWLPCT